MTTRPTPGNDRRARSSRRETWAGVIALVVILLVGYVSYTSSSGLPWSSDYALTAELPNAERLIPGSEVDIAGERVGQITTVVPVAQSGDTPAHARVGFKVEPDVRLPEDTSVVIRPSSVLGASYLELRPGQSTVDLAQGGRIPLASSESSPRLTDLFDVFDKSTARNLQQGLTDLSGGFAGRGGSFNSSLESLASVMAPLAEVSRTLASGQTRLGDFISSYSRVAAELDATGGELAGLMRHGSATFAAVDSARQPLQATLDRLSPAEVSGTRALNAVSPALDNLAKVMRALRPAGNVLRPALHQANTTLARGVPAMARVPELSNDLDETFATLRTVTGDPATSGAIRKLTEGMDDGGQLFDTFRAAQEQCNAFTLWSTGLGDLWGGTGAGSGPSHALIGLGLARMGAVGEVVQQPKPSPDVAMNYVPNNNDKECESGNEIDPGGQAIGNPPGLQSRKTWDTELPEAVLAAARKAGLMDAPPWRNGR